MSIPAGRHLSRHLSQLFSALAERPWLPAPPPMAAGAALPAATLGLGLMLGVITTLFALFSLALLIRAQLPDWAALTGAPGSPFASVTPLWINTAILLAGSIAMQCASRAARRGRPAAAAFILGGLCAFLFLLGQGLVWQQLTAAGHRVAEGPALGFFYLLTAAHGLHLAGGLAAWCRVARRRWSGTGADLRGTALAIRLCARYWHFLLLVWLALFALLASPPTALHAFAEICGIR